MSVTPRTGHASSGATAESLARIHRALTEHLQTDTTSKYLVPSLWRDPLSTPHYIDVRPFEYYSKITGSLLDSTAEPIFTHEGEGGDWSRQAVVYNMMIRASTAVDHDDDGSLGLPTNAQGWRETGSFLKAMAMIPFIRSLGANTIHLLPVQEIGMDGRRGSLGSVYSVRDLLTFDETLSEPILGVSAGEQFKAFMEAAHLSGLRVVLELPLRTTSKDSVWIKDHPEWFYWVPKDVAFHPPIFSEESLRIAMEKVGNAEREGLPEPPLSYSSMFTDPPPRKSIRKENNRLVGTLSSGMEVVVPGAFADWPPNDLQPVWNDITYLKYYEDKRYNYISYNTIRMYSSSLTNGGTAAAGLWYELARVISKLVASYEIDGIMVDMAHALPAALTREIIGTVSKIHPDVSFWAEDFNRTPEQVSEGYHVVLGAHWAIQHQRDKFREMLSQIGSTPDLLPHLAAPETHNTRRSITRAGGERYSIYAWTMSNFIPAIPYLHAGFELGETLPINTGLGFTAEELKLFPAEKLALFSAAHFDWSRTSGLLELIRKVASIRYRYRKSCEPVAGTIFSPLEAGDTSILAFRRASPGGGEPFLVIGNSDMERSRPYKVVIDQAGSLYRDLISGQELTSANGILEGELSPGQVLFLPELPKVDQVPMEPSRGRAS